jgi:hypothetical protein
LGRAVGVVCVIRQPEPDTAVNIAVTAQDLQTMPFWIPVAMAGIAAGITVFAYIATAGRERAKSRREAAARFRSAFAEAVTELDNVDAHSLITEARALHDAAIKEFRPSISPQQLDQFDAAVQKFYRYRSEVQPAPAKVLASLSSGKPVDHSDALMLKQALTELLAFADDI